MMGKLITSSRSSVSNGVPGWYGPAAPAGVVSRQCSLQASGSEFGCACRWCGTAEHTVITQIIDRRQIYFAPGGPELDDIADLLGVGRFGIELTVQGVVGNLAECAPVRRIVSSASNIGLQPELMYQFPHQFFGDSPAHTVQHQMDPAITRTLYVGQTALRSRF